MTKACSAGNDDKNNIVQHLDDVYTSMKGAARKITNSAQLIDFFVHDILDYAVLKGKK